MKSGVKVDREPQMQYFNGRPGFQLPSNENNRRILDYNFKLLASSDSFKCFQIKEIFMQNSVSANFYAIKS